MAKQGIFKVSQKGDGTLQYLQTHVQSMKGTSGPVKAPGISYYSCTDT